MSILVGAANVLKCFSPDRHEVTVTEAAALLSLPKSNVSRLLRSMREVGFLDTVGNSKRYRPGILLVEAAQIARRSSTLRSRADAVVSEITAEFGHTTYVSARLGWEVLALSDHTGTNVLRVASTVGERLQAFACATGRTLLARLDDEAVRALYPTPLDPPSKNAPQTLDDLLVRLNGVRRDGYAEADDEANRGVGGIAVAVGDPETSEEVSLCVTFPVATIETSERTAMRERLQQGAREIAAILGDPLFYPQGAMAR
ncbi:IclR family transcriptional regulator [Chelatococcus sp. GCM10030263]|uniref:IclR family transcriptional regulator n=1 Tax=Chelatococcus sp. GCM10030263 TaxID=3273387 RepID=UPI00361B76B2